MKLIPWGKNVALLTPLFFLGVNASPAYDFIEALPYDSIPAGSSWDSLFNLEKMAIRSVVHQPQMELQSKPHILVTVIPVQFSVIYLEIWKNGQWSMAYANQKTRPIYREAVQLSSPAGNEKQAFDSTVSHFNLNVERKVDSGRVRVQAAEKVLALSNALISADKFSAKNLLQLDCPKFLISKWDDKDSLIAFYASRSEERKIRTVEKIFRLLLKESENKESQGIVKLIKHQREILCKD